MATAPGRAVSRPRSRWRGRREPRSWSPSSDQTRSLRLGLTGYGFITVEERKTRVIASTVEVSADKRTLRIAGTADLPCHPCSPGCPLQREGRHPGDGRCPEVRTNDGSNAFTADFLLPQNPWGGEEVMPEAGAYSVRFVLPGSRRPPWATGSRRRPGCRSRCPARIDADRLEVGVSRTSKNGALTIHLRPPFAADEVGRFEPTDAAHSGHAGPGALNSRTPSCSCASAGAAPRTARAACWKNSSAGAASGRMYWAVADFSVPVPAGTEPVLIGSRLWYQLLTESRILINNNNFPFYFRKREGQVYIQTWHGTPLKKLGNDVARTSFSLSYWNLMWREAEYWDALLAQNEYAAGVLAKLLRL